MKALVTGAGGTVGSALGRALLDAGHEVVAWNRAEVPPDRRDRVEEFVRAVRPDALYHLAVASKPTGRPDEGRLVSEEWTAQLSELSRETGARFIYTSTVMVWSDKAEGPFRPETPPDAEEGYGAEKRRAEELARDRNPESIVARLGWQIGTSAGSNNMLDFLEREAREKGEIRASRRWLPACSFLPDTADALVRLAEYPPGTYLLDGNVRWSFFDIVEALNVLHERCWKIVPMEDFVFDQRMIDARIPLEPLSRRLPVLEAAGRK